MLEAEDGAQAIQRCRDERPDVVVMNVEMPVMDGRQTLRELKRDADLAEIPVILLTGRRTTPEMVGGLELGAHDYLCKPSSRWS